MVMVEVFQGFLLIAATLVQEISGKVMQVYEFASCFLYYLTIPFPIGFIPTLDLSVLPLIARGKGYQDRNASFFSHVVNEFL